jgi:hypothetical protein
MHAALTCLIARAPQGFTVHGDHPHRTGMASRPRADCGVQEITVHRLQGAPQRGFVRRPVQTEPLIPSRPQHRQDVLRGVGGPVADRGEGPGTGDHRGRGDEQDRYEGVPHPATSTWIRHPSEMFTQVNHLLHPCRHHTRHVIRAGQLVQRGRDRGRYSSRHGSLT